VIGGNIWLFVVQLAVHTGRQEDSYIHGTRAKPTTTIEPSEQPYCRNNQYRL
jgi:hypothetical protein